MGLFSTEIVGTIEWEAIQSVGKHFAAVGLYTYRAKVLGGWLVTKGDSLTFLPDPNHEWAPKPK